jgi:hypothetical protein
MQKYRRTFNDKHIARLCGVPSHHLIARNYKKITALLNQVNKATDACLVFLNQVLRC